MYTILSHLLQASPLIRCIHAFVEYTFLLECLRYWNYLYMVDILSTRRLLASKCSIFSSFIETNVIYGSNMQFVIRYKLFFCSVFTRTLIDEDEFGLYLSSAAIVNSMYFNRM